MGFGEALGSPELAELPEPFAPLEPDEPCAPLEPLEPDELPDEPVWPLDSAAAGLAGAFWLDAPPEGFEAATIAAAGGFAALPGPELPLEAALLAASESPEPAAPLGLVPPTFAATLPCGDTASIARACALAWHLA